MTFLAISDIIYRQNLSFGGVVLFYELKHFGLSEYFCKEYGNNFSFPVHLHQAFEFITILSGEMEIVVDKKLYILKKGESLLIFPNQLHSMNSISSEHMLCIFSPELVKAYSSKLTGKIPKSNKFIVGEYILACMDNLSDNSKKIKMKGILYSLCAEFDENAEYTNKNTDDKNLLFGIFSFVDSNYNKDCSLERLSKETGYSYSYLSRYFKNTVGISFNRYVNQYRINNACYILNNSDCSIIQCAMESGFSSLRSFNRNFKEITGITPKEYKEE